MRRKLIPAALIAIVVLLVVLARACSLFGGELEIEAQVIYEFGGPQPVARETFYLLYANIAQLTELRKAYEDARGQSEIDRYEHPSIPRLTMSDFLMADGKPFWKSHIVQSVQTDFQGRAAFKKIRPGNYWVMGTAGTRGDRRLIWNVPVSVGGEENKLLLSNDNYGFQ